MMRDFPTDYEFVILPPINEGEYPHKGAVKKTLDEFFSELVLKAKPPEGWEIVDGIENKKYDVRRIDPKNAIALKRLVQKKMDLFIEKGDYQTIDLFAQHATKEI